MERSLFVPLFILFPVLLLWTFTMHSDKLLNTEKERQRSTLVEEITTPVSQRSEEETVQFTQHLRQQMIKSRCEGCVKNKEQCHAPRQWKEVLVNLVVDETHRLVYCFIPKVACSNWKRYLLIQRGTVTLDETLKYDIHTNWTMWERAGLRLLSWYKPKTRKSILNEYHKFTFVRHPLHRLVSAYRDKFFFPKEDNRHIFNLYGEHIKNMYPETNNITTHQPSKFFITFKQFIEYVADRATSGDWLNDHFSPYYDLCRPCDIKYDFVGRMETMQKDSNFIIHNLFKNSSWHSLPGMSSKKKRTPGLEVRDLFQKLPRSLVSKLYFAFQTDFDMYGYSLEDFM